MSAKGYELSVSVKRPSPALLEACEAGELHTGRVGRNGVFFMYLPRPDRPRPTYFFDPLRELSLEPPITKTNERFMPHLEFTVPEIIQAQTVKEDILLLTTPGCTLIRRLRIK